MELLTIPTQIRPAKVEDMWLNKSIIEKEMYFVKNPINQSVSGPHFTFEGMDNEQLYEYLTDGNLFVPLRVSEAMDIEIVKTEEAIAS